MTNAEHSAKALSYDVAIGVCNIQRDDFRELRVAADWRLTLSLNENNPHYIFKEYFLSGKQDRESLSKWITLPNCIAAMPDKIIDRREHSAQPTPFEGRQP